jgi:membrane protease YdiL (CAAX protease family)
LTREDARRRVLIRIPLGTVLTEETIFRGVLPALFERSPMPLSPGVASALLFGLWHILPSLELSRSNAAVGRIVGSRRNAVAAAVATTTVAGLFLDRLREHTGHLAAPVMVHLAANVIGFEGARLARHRG